MSGAEDQCLIEIETLMGAKLTPSQRGEVAKKIGNMIKKLDKEFGVGNYQDKVMEALEKGHLETADINAKKKRNALIDAHHRVKLEQSLMANWADNPAEGLKAYIDSSLTSRKGSKSGMARTVQATKQHYVQGLLARLAKKDLLDFASSKEVDVKKQIWKAMYELNQPKPDKDALGKLLPEAVETAKIFNEMQEFARTQANRAGGWIGKLDGYVVKRTHSIDKIRKAAGEGIPYGSDAHQKAYVDWVKDNLDWDRSIPGLSPEKQLEFLNDMFTQFSNGYHVKFGGSTAGQAPSIGSTAKGLSHERVLHFKNAEAEFEYHEKFGNGSNLLESVTTGLQRVARDTAIMNHAGTNPEANIKQAVDNLVEKLTKDGRGADAKALLKEHDYLMDKVWPNINGASAIPGDADGARISAMARNWQMMCDLGRAVFASITDPLWVGSTARYTGERSSIEFMKGMSGIVKELVTNIGKGKNEIDAHIAAETGIGIETIGDSLGLLDPDLDTPGNIAKMVNTTFKLNGMTWWQDTIRLGSIKMTAARHAQYSDLPFDKIPEGMQSIFTQFEISAKDWDLIRSREKFTDPRNGSQLLLPEHIKTISDEEIAPLVGGMVNENKIKSYRENLQTKYRNLFSEIASWSTSEPGAGVRGMVLRGTKPGTWEGEALRHLAMYKTFMFSVMRNHIGRELHGYRPDTMSTPAALKAMFTDPKGGSLGGIANILVWAPVLGYMSSSAKEIAQGKEPRVPTDAASFGKIMAASYARSGALGLYGDFLFGEVTEKYGQDFVLGLMGPTARRAADIGNLYGRVRKGDDAGAEAFKFFLNNTPGYNLPYTKVALDYLLAYRVQETINPGYLRRMEKRMKKEKGQEFMIPPSSVIQRGGGF